MSTNTSDAGLPELPPLSHFLENSTHDMQRDAIRKYARTAQAEAIARFNAELIEIARAVEDLKRPCGMDPESPVAIQNGRYMGISHRLRALAGSSHSVEPTPYTEPRWSTPPAAQSADPLPSGAVSLACAEVEKATRKFPTWPTDPLHAVAVLGEEFGELTKAVLQLTYEPHKTSADEVRTEAIQTAAMALRFLMSLDAYRFAKSDQHEQGAQA